MPTTTAVHVSASIPKSATHVVVVGRRRHLEDLASDPAIELPKDTWKAMLAALDPGDWGASTGTWAGKRKVTVCALPERCSRHNSPTRAWAIPEQARKANGGDAAVLLLVDRADHAQAVVCAAARAFPLYDVRSGTTRKTRVDLVVRGPKGPVDLSGLQSAVDGVRLAARLVDMPCSELHTDAFVAEAQAVAATAGAAITVIQGEQALNEEGLGGIWGVGKAATHTPALVILDHNPADAQHTVAWVGKGIVYDTGGLSIKTKAGMPGMKGDMGGAAAVLGAFAAAAKEGVPYRIIAVLCLAENAVGPEATRPDDILHMHSGKTVEVNNTDAEGRLVLADGLSWVLRHHQPELVLDLATLTGAALVATGKVHAAVYANTKAGEDAVVSAGKLSGDPVFPILYAPELLQKEFKSHVADLKNSVKDRGNAQSSCAGRFIENHLPSSTPHWVHVDLAGPAWDSNNRGSGFGVSLLLTLGAPKL